MTTEGSTRWAWIVVDLVPEKEDAGSFTLLRHRHYLPRRL